MSKAVALEAAPLAQPLGEGKSPCKAPRQAPGIRRRLGSGPQSRRNHSPPLPLAGGAGEALSQPLRTKGGEPTVTRLASAGLQLRRAEPGRMTRAAEPTFLRAPSDRANLPPPPPPPFPHSTLHPKAPPPPVLA